MNNIDKVYTDLKELFEYLKQYHSNLPTHVFETMGEILIDLKTTNE